MEFEIDTFLGFSKLTNHSRSLQNLLKSLPMLPPEKSITKLKTALTLGEIPCKQGFMARMGSKSWIEGRGMEKIISRNSNRGETARRKGCYERKHTKTEMVVELSIARLIYGVEFWSSGLYLVKMEEETQEGRKKEEFIYWNVQEKKEIRLGFDGVFRKWKTRPG